MQLLFHCFLLPPEGIFETMNISCFCITKRFNNLVYEHKISIEKFVFFLCFKCFVLFGFKMKFTVLYRSRYPESGGIRINRMPSNLVKRQTRAEFTFYVGDNGNVLVRRGVLCILRAMQYEQSRIETCRFFFLIFNVSRINNVWRLSIIIKKKSVKSTDATAPD